VNLNPASVELKNMWNYTATSPTIDGVELNQAPVLHLYLIVVIQHRESSRRVRVKVNPGHAYAETEAKRCYRSKPFTTSALERVDSQHHTSPVFSRLNTRY
jgi:hypothetical protein